MPVDRSAMSLLKASSSFHACGKLMGFHALSSKPGRAVGRVPDGQLPAGIEIVQGARGVRGQRGGERQQQGKTWDHGDTDRGGRSLKC
jgi:hypothetical protein